MKHRTRYVDWEIDNLPMLKEIFYVETTGTDWDKLPMYFRVSEYVLEHKAQFDRWAKALYLGLNSEDCKCSEHLKESDEVEGVFRCLECAKNYKLVPDGPDDFTYEEIDQ